ncbi:hypothetical protein WA026_015560 [Henosepilachna vigintioctopunctata]|uniref:Uncharacterized protein n=1 Tax=Henosepilachna vigintioctopunctata TaxID=420089 RepID=A0AAW1VD29_9CUCU
MNIDDTIILGNILTSCQNQLTQLSKLHQLTKNYLGSSSFRNPLERYSLRQLDLSLLSQLWSLNESIQDFRQILQEQEDCRILSPPSPSPSPSSGDEGDGEEQYYVNTTPSMKFRPAPPPPPPARRSSNSSNASTGG